MEEKSISEILKLFRTVNENFRFLKRDRFKHIHVTSSQGMVIGLIIRNGQTKISTTSEMIKRLESQNILVRKKDEKDRRIVTVDLTEDYKKKADEHHHFFKRFAFEIFEDATDEETEKIIEGLSVMNKLMEYQISKSKNEGDCNE